MVLASPHGRRHDLQFALEDRVAILTMNRPDKLNALALTSDFRALLDREAITHLRCGQTADHREGVAAFLEKREPRFRGR